MLTNRVKVLKSESKLVILLAALRSQKVQRTTISLFLIGLLVTSVGVTLSQLAKRQDTRSRAATVPNRIPWQGKDWYLLGANVPWYNWACDFGCNQNGGVSGNRQTFQTGFQKLKDNNIHVARWWVFPGDPWQITRDAQGPTGLNSAIYADFDAALELAEQYDLYYNFVLFSGADAPPSAWLNDPTQRLKLGQALTPLFARYANNPRVMSWEIYNEPEFQIWNNQVDQTATVETAKVIANTVHQNSPALVTVGSAFADGMALWKDVPLDYYSPHWYDYMNSGGFCMRCETADQKRTRFGITDNKPIVIGETYAGPDVDAQARMNDFYTMGYAGAWPWSLFPDRTNDRLAIDFPALKTFTTGKTDIGPTSIAPSTNTPTLTPSATPILTHTLSPTSTLTPTSTQTPTSSPSPTRTPTPTNSPTPTITGKIGDLNNDNQVNVFDLSILLSNFNTTNSVADINHDGNVNVFDLSILLSNFGK